ncbi:MAG: hypothetical protein AAF829_02700 [Pseudomonadota bacterium]
MSDTSAKDDLEFLRDLADAGAHAPLLGGRFLAWWGGIITLAYGLHFALFTGQFGLSADYIGLMWVTVVVIALAGQFAMAARFPRDKPGTSSAGNRARVVWTAAGLSIFAFFAGTITAAAMEMLPSFAANYSIPLVFSVYACALMVTGTLARDTILTVAAWIAIVMVAVTAFRVSSAEVYLLAMLGVFLAAFVPGLLQMRAEPKSVV